MNASLPVHENGLDPLAKIQEHFALINLDGKVWVLDLDRFATPPADGGSKVLTLSNRSDGSLLIKRATRKMFPGANASDVVKEFFASPDTTCYAGVEFNPARTTDGFLNLWTGPTAHPCEGDWSLIRQFL